MDPLLDPEAASPRRGADEDELRPVVLANSQTMVSEITLAANQSLFRGPLYPSQSNLGLELDTIHSTSETPSVASEIPNQNQAEKSSKAPSSTASSNKKPSRDNNHHKGTTSAAAKCYSPVRYRGQDGTLTCTATLLVYTPSGEAEEELVWPCSTIARHMIKSMPGQNKHMLRLVFHDGQGDPVILEVATREMVEQIKADIGSARKRLAAGGSKKRKPSAAAEKPFAKKGDEDSVQSVFSNTPKRKGPSPAAAKKPIEEASSTRKAAKPGVNPQSDTPSFLGMDSGHAPERTRGTAGGDLAGSESANGDNSLNADPESARDDSREASASNTHNSPGGNRRTTASPNNPNQSSSVHQNTANAASVPGAHSISGGATFDAAVTMKSLDSLEEMQESATRRNQQSATRGNHNSRPTRANINASHNSQNSNNSSSRRQRTRRRAASPHRAASSSSPPPPPNRAASVPGAHSVSGGSANAASIAKALDTLEGGVGQAESESDFMRSVVRERQGLPDPKESSSSPRRTTSQGSSSAPVPRTGRRPRQRPRPRSNQALPTVPLRAVASQPNIAPPPTGVPRRSASDSLPLVDDEDYPDDLVLRAIQKERQHAQEVSSSSRKKKPPPHAQVQSEQDAPVSRHGKRLPEQDDPEQPEVTRNRQRLPEQYAQDQAQQPSRRNRNTRQAPREAGNTEEFIASIETSPLPPAQAPPLSQPGATQIRGFDASEHASERTITIGGGSQDLQAGDDLEQQQPIPPSDATVTPDLEVLIEAHVVEDTSASYERDGVIRAKPMSEREAIGCREIWKSPTGRMAFVILALVMVIITMAVILFLVLGPANDKEDSGKDFVPLGLTRRPTRAPLDRPTPAPTLSPGQPTLEPGAPLPGASELFDQQYSGLLLDSTYVAMEDPSTPQSQAREWLLTDPGLGDYKRHRRIQRFTLATFYFATQGDQWTNNFNWLSRDIECQWQYITCSGGGQLHQISIARNNLQGSLVPEMGLLKSMQVLELTDNPRLQGTLPANFGLLTNLNVLKIRLSELEGPLPLQIGDMASLESIMLSNSPQLDGSIPSEIGRLTNLKSLILNANSLSGNIPKEIGDLTLLGELDLAQNALEGSVPDEFGSLAYLERLYLQENEIGGSLSPELGGMTLLVAADLSFTNVEGVVPFCNGGDTNVKLDGTQASCP